MEKVKLHTRMYGWKHVWMEFAEEFQGSVDDPNPDSSQTGMSIMVPIKNTPWILVYTLDPGKKGKQGHTTVETNYVGSSNFQFSIHPQKQLSALSKLFGMQDIVIGNKEFDLHFVVKGNDVSRVRDIFAHERICALVIDEPTVEISVRPDSTDSKPATRILAGEQHVLSLKIPGIVDDFERLKNLYNLAEILLVCLCVEEPSVALAETTSSMQAQVT
jgi:hypothetical protein